MKKIIKYFSLILFCSFFMFLISNNKINAVYESSKNKVNISVSRTEVKITVVYQRGLAVGDDFSRYLWCSMDSEYSEVSDKQCAIVGGWAAVNYVEKSGNSHLTLISQSEPSYSDVHLTEYTFVVPKNSDPFLKNTIAKNQYYTLIVVHNFCAVRKKDAYGNYSGCSVYDTENIYTKLKVSTNDLLNGKVVGGAGTATDEIEDDGMKTLMDKVYDIVHGTVMPIIWAVLGLFLLIKGSLLGVQIVKSADEPQVRQEKVGALKWLVIGVAIAYASSFLVDIVIGFFSNAFK